MLSCVEHGKSSITSGPVLWGFFIIIFCTFSRTFPVANVFLFEAFVASGDSC